MPTLRRLVLVRHGESDGNSAQRLIGSGDPGLSAAGRQQMIAARARLVGVVELVVASPARRSWQSAEVLTGGASLRLETDFREIHFGRWEGKSLAELEASDPILYKQWLEGTPEFEYPGGELRSSLRARVGDGLERLLHSGATSALVVAHKGVIRTILEKLGLPLPERAQPALGEVILATRDRDGWILGARSSNPPGIPIAAPVEIVAPIG